MDAPEQIGLIPSLLQHASAEIGERHYNLANAIKASQRFAQHRASIKNRLRLIATEALRHRGLGSHHAREHIRSLFVRPATRSID